MSYIDTIKHEIVGHLNGLPIYHPLEIHKEGAWSDPYFSCTPDNLILGGGAGEHPALVIHGLGALVARYILHYVDTLTDLEKNYPALPDDTTEWLQDLAFPETSEMLEFCGWRMVHYSKFVENAKSQVNGRPLENPEKAEEWIKLSIGEFVFFSMPDLNPYQDEMLNLAGIKGGEKLGCLMNNVTCPPPNYVKSKKQSLQGSGFREYGFFRWDYRYPPAE